MGTPPTEPPGRPSTPLLSATLVLGINTGLVCLLLLSAWLRETPLFWRHAGGFPLLLRDMVKYAFPPCFVMDVLLVGSACAVILRHRRANRELANSGLLLAAFQALMLAAVLMLVLANNVDNLIHDRPWHWKPAPGETGLLRPGTHQTPTAPARRRQGLATA